MGRLHFLLGTSTQGIALQPTCQKQLLTVKKALQARPTGTSDIPHKFVVAKRLAQCLNPVLPSGVHQKTLEVYGYIFSVLNVRNINPAESESCD